MERNSPNVFGGGATGSYQSSPDRDEALKLQLSQIDAHLDLDKLIAEVKMQHTDSYTLR